MEKRRSRLWLALATAVVCSSGWACVPALEGTRLESARHVLVFKAAPISVSEHFSLEIAACAKSGAAPESLKIDAHMPEHRHGMNYAPSVTRVGPGRWRAEGLLLHMPGRWRLLFDLERDGRAERLAADLVLE